MPVRYSTNWMGVANLQWYRDRGLTKRVSKTLTKDSELTGRKAGDIVECDEITEHYACGRIDCRGEDLGIYGDEIGLPPMKVEHWNRFSAWLETFETDFMWPLENLVWLYEQKNPKIEWWTE